MLDSWPDTDSVGSHGGGRQSTCGVGSRSAGELTSRASSEDSWMFDTSLRISGRAKMYRQKVRDACLWPDSGTLVSVRPQFCCGWGEGGVAKL